jgi:hypothetical protein
MATVRKYQNNFTTGVISPGVYARVDLQKYESGCKRIINGVIHAHGGISNRPGTRYVDTLPGDGILIPFVYSVTQTYVLCFFDPRPLDTEAHTASIRIYKEGGVVVDSEGNPVETETPYLPGELSDIKFAQSADTMFLVHPKHPPMKLTRTSHTEWAFEEIMFVPEVPTPTGLEATPSGFTDNTNTYVKTTAEYKVAAVNEREIESMPSEAASAEILSTWPTGARVELTWQAVEGAVRYEVYKNSRGYYAWVGSAETTKFTDDNIEGDSATGPKENRNPFDGAGKYPGAVGIYQQRLIFGRSNEEPQTVWCSETGAFDSMAVAQPLRDDSAITATVDSKQMNEIRHFIPLRDMLMLTSGAEFKMSAGQNSDAISPLSLRFDIQSYWGSSNVPPIVSGTSIVMVQNSGKAVRDLHYTFSEDGYSGNEVSILAEHLLDSPVRDWAYQQSPFSTIWICLDSGKLLTFTYMREQEVWAWSEHESSGGRFRSVSVIREGEQDNVYFLTKRGESYFVEYQVRRDYGDPITDAFFVDCGLDGELAGGNQVKGLQHLAGQEVVALADGSVIKGLTVGDDGSVELPFGANKVIVGLPYRMLVETLDPEIRGENGVLVGEKRNIPTAVVVLRESRGPKIGRDENTLMTLKLPVPEKYSEPPPLFSGEIKTVLPGRHEQSATIVMVQDDPLPVTVLAVATHISVG